MSAAILGGRACRHTGGVDADAGSERGGCTISGAVGVERPAADTHAGSARQRQPRLSLRRGCPPPRASRARRRSNLSSYGYAGERVHDCRARPTSTGRAASGALTAGGGVSVAQSSVPYTHAPARALPDGSVEVQWHRGSSSGLNDTTGGDQDPVVVGDLQRGPVPGLRLYRRDGAGGQAWSNSKPGMLNGTARSATATTGSPMTSSARPPEVGAGRQRHAPGQAQPGEGHRRGATRNPRSGWTPTSTRSSRSATRFDGFLAIGRSAFRGAPSGSGLIAFWPAPAYVRTDNTTPFIQLNTEGDIEELGAALVRQPDKQLPADLGAVRRRAHRSARGDLRGAPPSSERAAAGDGAAMRVRRSLQRGDPARQSARSTSLRTQHWPHWTNGLSMGCSRRTETPSRPRRSSTSSKRDRYGNAPGGNPDAGHPGTGRDLHGDQLLPAQPGEA